MKSNLQLPFSGKKNRFSFSSNHETTLNFGSILPCYCKDLVPGEDLSVFTRFAANVAPMLVPTFGDVRVKFHSYFVPYSSVWDYFNDFIVGKVTPTPNGNMESFVQFDEVPLIHQSEFINMFVNAQDLTRNGTSSNYDIAVPIIDGQQSHIAYRLFTRRGKVAYQILQSLGYNIDFSIGIAYGQRDPLHIDYNALPLLSFCKLFFEHFIPQQYKADNKWRNFYQYLHSRVPDTNGHVYISQEMLNDLMSNFTLCYTQDYFTAQWNYPNMITPGLVDTSDYYDVVSDPVDTSGISHTGEIVAVDDDGTTGQQNTDFPSTPWAQRLAEKIQGWITRNNLAGSDYINRILANFGVKPVERLGVVQFCGDYETQLKIDSVFDTAGTDGKPLASYAGRGFIREKMPYFKCSVKEHGMFFIVATVQPLATFTDGVDRQLLYKNRFDYFTADFDGLAMQATPICEVFNSFISGIPGEKEYKDQLGFASPRNIIGFNPRYAERKMEKCRVTGDFNIRSLASSVAPYSLQRYVWVDKFNLLQGLASGKSSALTLSDLVYQYDAAQYNRIFADTSGLPDPIFALFDFRSKLISPMKQLGDSFTQFNEGHKTISVEKNGGYTN